MIGIAGAVIVLCVIVWRLWQEQQRLDYNMGMLLQVLWEMKRIEVLKEKEEESDDESGS